MEVTKQKINKRNILIIKTNSINDYLQERYYSLVIARIFFLHAKYLLYSRLAIPTHHFAIFFK